MNLKEEKYNKYALVREMMETPGDHQIIRSGSCSKICRGCKVIQRIVSYRRRQQQDLSCKKSNQPLLKRIFLLPVITEGCTQAEEYNLNDYAVFAASNSGQTKEVIRLTTSLKKKKHAAVFGLTANPEYQT